MTIFHGDCREILPLHADAVVTDPPYGMDLDASFANSTDNPRKGIKASRGYEQVIGDCEPFDFASYFKLLEKIEEQFWFGADYYCQDLPTSGSWLTWDKRKGIEDLEYSSSEFELVWSRRKHHRKILRYRWFGLCGTETQDVRTRIHPCQKPTHLISDIIQISSALYVLDPVHGQRDNAQGGQGLRSKSHRN